MNELELHILGLVVVDYYAANDLAMAAELMDQYDDEAASLNMPSWYDKFCQN